MGSSKTSKVAAPTGMVDDVEAGLTGATVAPIESARKNSASFEWRRKNRSALVNQHLPEFRVLGVFDALLHGVPEFHLPEM